MSFGKFGAKPRGMSNPIYWVNMHLQDQRRQAAAKAAADKFNEKWHRLNRIFQNLLDNFIAPIDGKNINESEAKKLSESLKDTRARLLYIQKNINTCSVSELTKYATSIKKIAMISFKLCRKYGIYNDIEEIKYVSEEKSIFLNGESIYFLGQFQKLTHLV